MVSRKLLTNFGADIYICYGNNFTLYNDTEKKNHLLLFMIYEKIYQRKLSIEKEI